MTYRIMCIGEPLAEVSQGPSGMAVRYGGDTLNTAIYIAREAAQGDVAVQYVTALGQDIMSDGAFDLMQAEGIGTAFVTRAADRNIGIYAIKNDAAGERSFHYWRDDTAARQIFTASDDPAIAAIAGADLVYLSAITLAILQPQARETLFAALETGRAKGTVIAFDSNHRPQLWESHDRAQQVVARMWALTDIALPTLEDETALFGHDDPAALRDHLRAVGVTRGAIKQGAKGPMPLDPQIGAARFEKAKHVVDTTGAGDSFNGGYLAALALGASEADALQRAHDLARRVVGHKGAIMPRQPVQDPQRVGSVIRLRPEHAAEYLQLHADVWPGVLARLKASNIQNYSIFLKRPEHLMFGYFEYTGDDFAADDAAIAADPVTRDWWAVCGPMQDPFETRADGEWWATMEQVFFLE